MKIVHVPRRYTLNAWGGTETCISELTRHQVRQGHSVSIKTSLALSDREREIVNGTRIERFGYCYPYFGITPAEKTRMDLCGGNMLSLPLLRNLLRSQAPDILHLHTGKRMGAIGRTAARKFGIPYVVSVHGGVFDVPGGFSQGQSPVVTRGEWGKAFGAVLGARRVLEDADAILCVSREEARLAQSRFPNKRIDYVPNGVDCARFASGDAAIVRERFGIPRDRRILLNVGRIDPQKNQQVLVQALAGLRHRDLHLLLIGPITDESYARSLRNGISDSGCADRITLIEGLGPDDPLLLSAYRAADLFCLPSVHEPFGIVVLEAWAAGIPTLTSRVGGLRDLVKHRVTGIHVENDVDAWRRTIEEGLDSSQAMLQISRSALSHVRTHYDWSGITQQVIGIYDDLVCEHREIAA